MTLRQINTFLMFKLPSAFWCGVRAEKLSGEHCITRVRFRWINQNPFGSMYFAVQAMAAELSTGALVMLHIRQSQKNYSMLVASNRATFHKKAVGTIRFACQDGAAIAQTLADAADGEGRKCTMRSIGVDENGDTVCEMEFDWTVRLRR